jgi:UDPglucose--hexose-1-phosphate uridylyltransferase
MNDQNMQFPHRRFDPLRGRWVLVSPHRTQRPWQGEVSRTDTKPAVHYDPDCYLCPGNVRAGGKQNPQYTGVFAFANDYAALLPDSPRWWRRVAMGCCGRRVSAASAACCASIPTTV